MRLQRPILLALAVVSLLWVAVDNGYPLVWWDSGSYIYTSCRLEVLPSRPVFYGLFLLATHWRLTLWSSIVAQAVLLVYVLRVVLDDEDGGRTAATRLDGELLAICLCLAAGTILPWLAGQVMADVFTGIAVLCLYHLVASNARRPMRIAVAAILIGSLTVHFGHLPLIAGVAALLQCAAWAGYARPRAGGLRIAWLCIAVAATALAISSWLLTGRAFAGTTHVHILGRLFDDGTAQRLLAEHCSDRDYRLCADREHLPASFREALWGDDSPVARLGGWYESEAESWRMIRDALADYPRRVARSALGAGARQLQTFQMLGEMVPLPDDSPTNRALERYFPHEYESYRRSRQQLNTLPRVRTGRLHWWVVIVSAVLSLCFLAAHLWRGRTEAVRLHALVWLAVLVNASLIGVVTEPHSRYGARIAWLLPLSVLLSLARVVNARLSRQERRHVTG
jgi:hypothetical protein